MEARELRALAQQVADGALSPDELVRRVGMGSVADLGYAQVDLERGLRTGVH